MGYTHYFTHSDGFSPDEWITLTEDVVTILETAVADGLALGDGMGEKKISPKAAIVTNGIRFNGLGDECCETFSIERQAGGWDFCKTCERPYDVAVTAILLYLEGAHPNKFSVGSDGKPEDWQPGLALVKKALGTRAAFAQIPAEILEDAA